MESMAGMLAGVSNLSIGIPFSAPRSRLSSDSFSRSSRTPGEAVWWSHRAPTDTASVCVRD